MFVDPSSSILLVCWVDDSFMFYPPNRQQRARDIISTLKRHFNVKQLGPVKDMLSIQVIRNIKSKQTYIHQEDFVLKLLKKAQMEDCSTEPTPVSCSAKFTKADCPTSPTPQTEEQAKWYRSIVASCIFLATWTRPDISFAVSKLCKFMANPGEVHVQAAKRLLSAAETSG